MVVRSQAPVIPMEGWEASSLAGERGPATCTAIMLALTLIAGPSAASTLTQAPEHRQQTSLGPIAALDLEPADPRAPALIEAAPEAAAGLYEAHASETGVHLWLVSTGRTDLGVLATPAGARWVTVDDGALIPYRASAETGVSLAGDTERAPSMGPGDPSDSRSMHEVDADDDGVIQIALDGDSQYWVDKRSNWDEHQLQVAHLVNGFLRASTGIGLEVVRQHTYTWAERHDEPYTSNKLCDGFDLLDEFKEHWETERTPTGSAPREAAHLFAGRGIQGTTIGCAFVREIETEWAYGVSKILPDPFGDPARYAREAGLYRDAILVGHELGHNMGGSHDAALGAHCSVASIMFPILCYNRPSYSGAQLYNAAPACQQLGVDSCLQWTNAPSMRDYTLSRT